MPKTHFTVDTHFTVCGRVVFPMAARPLHVKTDTSRVTCLTCRTAPEFVYEAARQERENAYAIAYSMPTMVQRFSTKMLECRVCNFEYFLNAGRSLDYNYHICCMCGTTNSTLTETGMSA